MSGPAITEINKDTFWNLLAQAKTHCGQDLSAETVYITDQLRQMEPEQSLRFHCIMHRYSDAAYKFGLWSAACILAHGCTDDGFIDFRAWLMAQGKDAFLGALKDPDSLADVKPYGECCFEDLYGIGYHVFQEKTGRSAFDEPVPGPFRAELNAMEKEIVYSPIINYPLEWNELETHLPKLCAKYMNPFQIAANVMGGAMMWNPASMDVQAARKRYKPKKAKSTRKKGGEAR